MHESNTRIRLVQLQDQYQDHEPWFGIEQKYTFFRGRSPLGWPAPGYPKRPVPRNDDAAKALKKRTLTNLSNTRPQWLADAHAALDAAVAAAYGTHRKEQLLCHIQPDCCRLHRGPSCDSRWMSLVSIPAHSKP